MGRSMGEMEKGNVVGDWVALWVRLARFAHLYSHSRKTQTQLLGIVARPTRLQPKREEDPRQPIHTNSTGTGVARPRPATPANCRMKMMITTPGVTRLLWALWD